MKHFIGKQTIEIKRNSKKDAFEFQQSASRTYRDTILPALNDLFDRFSHEEQLIAIDKLEINLGAVGKKEFLNGAFLKKILEQMEEQLLRVNTGTHQGVKKTNVRLGRFESYLHFLKQGSFPRYSNTPKTDFEQDLLEILAINATAAAQFKKLLSTNARARKRVVLQFSTTFLIHLVELFTAEKQSELQNIFQAFEQARRTALDKSLPKKEQLAIEHLFQKHFQSVLKNSASFSYQQIVELVKKQLPNSARALETDLWETLLQILFVGAFKATPVGYIPMMLNERAHYHLLLPFLEKNQKAGKSKVTFIHKKATFPILNKGAVRNLLAGPKREMPHSIIPADSSTPEEQPLQIDPQEAWHIDHAGLVLIHPFIPNLLEKTGLTENKMFPSDTQQQRALGLLHYIVSGQEKALEFELTLPKLLCGIPLGTPVDAGLSLTEKLKQEANELLKVVIKHWGALGNVSPDSLREGFLHRDGKLTKKGTGWHLQVERKTIDLLLDQLPWGIGMVSTPWMKEILMVDWN